MMGLYSNLSLVILLLTSSVVDSARIRGICPGRDPPLATVGNSCGVPDFVNVPEFGDNMDTTGVLRATGRHGGLNIRIHLKNLPKPNLVLTAWLIWVPFGVTDPSIFKVANHASPCAPFNASFSTGFSIEPNQFVYSSRTRATLRTALNFNPTHPGEGPLTREVFSFQKDVTGIQNTKLKQFTTPDGVFIPTSSSYLRKYDQKTGFEKLDKTGRPVVARSPIKALGVEIIAHVDKTTHGIAQGVGNVDHYFVLFFPFEKLIGMPTM